MPHVCQACLLGAPDELCTCDVGEVCVCGDPDCDFDCDGDYDAEGDD